MNTVFPLSTSCLKPYVCKGGRRSEPLLCIPFPRHLRSLHSHQASALQPNRWLLLCLQSAGLLCGFILMLFSVYRHFPWWSPYVCPLEWLALHEPPATRPHWHCPSHTRFLKHLFHDAIITLKNFGSFLFSASSKLNLFALLSKTSMVATIQLTFVAFSSMFITSFSV